MKSKIDVVQIHRSTKIFTKANYTSENREDFWSFSKVIESEIGYLSKGVLFLPIEYERTQNFHGCELIILIDGLGFGYYSKTAEIKVFRGVKAPKEVEIFKIQKVRSNFYELSLNYKNNSWIGSPERNNHKIGDLLVGQIVRYQLNGKSDFKERNFFEFDYHFELLGQATSVKFRKVEELVQLKQIRNENFKFINERKILH